MSNEIVKDFSWPVNTFNEDEYLSFIKILNEHKDRMDGRPLFVFGAGIRGCMFIRFLQDGGINITGVTDNDENKWDGTIFNKYRIESLSWTLNQFTKPFFIISVENSEKIVLQLRSKGLAGDDDFFIVPPVLYDNFIGEFYGKPNADTLIMGDCLFSTVGMDDTDKKSLGGLIFDKVDNRDKVKLLSVHGMPNHTFYHMLDLQVKLGVPIKRVLLSVNLAMLSGKKNQLPRAQHTPLLKKIHEKMPFQDEGYDEYIRLTEERMNRFNTDSFVRSPKNARGHNSETIVNMRMRQNYMYRVKADNEGVVYLDKIHWLCQKKNIRLIVMFPPINYMHGREIFGDEFVEYCEHNTNELIKRLILNGEDVIDLTLSLKSDMFAATDTINEITNYAGRLKETEYIMEHLR